MLSLNKLKMIDTFKIQIMTPLCMMTMLSLVPVVQYFIIWDI